jgi:GT2 family glycosyltransferase
VNAFISLVVPLKDDDPAALTPTVTSLIAQDSADWQLVITTRHPDHIREWLLKRISAGHVRVVGLDENVTLTEAASAGMAQSAGRFVSFLAPGDSLEQSAVRELAEATNPDVDVVYTNDVVDGRAVLKPVFSAERLRSQNYIGNLVAFRATHLADIGGLRSNVAGAELYDLLLRATRDAAAVKRVESTLFIPGARSLHEVWGIDDDARLASMTTVLLEHMEATGGGIVRTTPHPGVYATRRLVQGSPLVSIVIPSRGDSATIRGKERCLLVEVVRSILEKSTYSNFEIVIVLDDVSPQSVRNELDQFAEDRIRFVPWSKPFSFSAKMNLGVLRSQGEFLLFLNDDIEVISPDWIEAMLALAQRPRAGLAGAMLYFEDETIQHAGHAYYRSDVTHIGLNSERGAAGPDGAFLVEREVDGVTAACSMMPRHVFFEAGGFSDLLPGNFNDVDLCMKVAALGYAAYWTPHAELYHYESKSRDPRVALYEIETAWARWEHEFWDSKYWPTDPHIIYRRA